MSVTADPLAAAPPPRLFSFMRGFRLIPRIDTYPWVVRFAQTIVGKATLLALFGLGLYYATYLHYLHNDRWKVQICCLVVITALPKYRRYSAHFVRFRMGIRDLVAMGRAPSNYSSRDFPCPGGVHFLAGQPIPRHAAGPKTRRNASDWICLHGAAGQLSATWRVPSNSGI